MSISSDSLRNAADILRNLSLGWNGEVHTVLLESNGATGKVDLRVMGVRDAGDCLSEFDERWEVGR